MDHKSIVNGICDQADDFLAGVSRREEARAGIAEILTMRHASLPPPEKKAVIDEVMRVLEREGFFDRDAGGSDEDDVPEME
ncbi:MAG TPA: hypothetical protein VHD32_18640 [Candidatus Didemnitutus sp.]|nr:hypothetical protein [Candidatus Didemnitutus sp.]